MNSKHKVIISIPILCGLLLLGWAAQSGGGSPAKERWLRVMSMEMELTPKMDRVFQPHPYQYVEVVVGAGEFGHVTAGSVLRRTAPSGEIASVRLDTSDDQFLVIALGGVDNLGKWRNRVVHYVPWDKIVDIYFEVSPIAGGIVR